MKRKRVLSLLLAACVMSGALAACSPGQESSSGAPAGSLDNLNEEGYPIVKESITVSMMGMKHPIHGDWSQMKFFTIMQEKTGIGFEFDTPAAEVYEEKKNLALNGSTYPEVFFAGNISQDQQIKYGSQGILVPLEDYIDKYCPNILECFEKNPGFREALTAPDGHIYALAQITDIPYAMLTPMWVNKDWLDALGIADTELPTTAEGFRELLIRFRDEDPNGNGEKDEVPFVIFDDVNKGTSLYNYMLPWFGVLSPTFYLGSDDKIHFGMTEENAKVGMQYIAQLYQEKLIDNDCFINGSAESTAKGSEGKVGAGFHALPRYVFGNMTEEKEATYPAMPSLSSSVNPEQTSTRTSGITHGAFALTNKCVEAGHAEAMMRWVDYLYSEEGSFFVGNGPEGILWKKSDTNPDKLVSIPPTDGRNSEEIRGGEITPDCGGVTPKWLRSSSDDLWENNLLTQSRAKWVNTNVFPYAKTVMPDLFLNSEDQSRLSILSTDLNKYLYENAAKFITGDKSFDEWDSFVQGFEQMGMSEMLQIYQAAYESWAANSK